MIRGRSRIPSSLAPWPCVAFRENNDFYPFIPVARAERHP